MSHYRSNLRDVEFNLFEVLGVQDRFTGPFAQMDEPTARAILTEVERLAREEFAASFVEADRHHLEVHDGDIALPDSVKESLRAFYDGGWGLLGLPEHLGGVGAPLALYWGATEFLLGGNSAIFFYISGGLMAGVIDVVGTDEQRETWARWMIEKEWGGTMVLTEPDAGSDVGAGLAKAHHVEGEVYHLEGVKRFITSGDSDFHENIVHLVLARPEGAGPGTKGLSMFIVPKFLVNEDGSLGERNGAVVTAVEDKMGIRGSSTCELTLGADRPCVGYLVGGVHEGIRQMFLVIEHARLTIGTKSMATLSTGYLNALEYAKERIQGPDLAEARDPEAPRVPIIRHPDVRRMLMEQKAHAEAMRALVLYTAAAGDRAKLEPEEPYWHKLEDLLLPLAKGYSSEKAYELLGQSLQVFGGVGFTRDYPLEQYIRDVKIDTLYEGTTGIQALDLFFRKIARDRGETLMKLAAEITETVKGGGPDDPLATERELLGAAGEDVQGLVGVLVGHLMAAIDDPAQVHKTGLHTNALLEGLAELVMGWLLIRHAEVALAKLGGDPGADRGFYEGKVASARWFAANVLPKAALRRRVAEAEDGWLMSMDDAAF
ncbi:MAG TPA: acyl-CoA dehydrogenase [Acidimicrobiia bacterium]|nr:acyl-CoA dehydrogenase [Acidimicrobiia bacterium]